MICSVVNVIHISLHYTSKQKQVMRHDKDDDK